MEKLNLSHVNIEAYINTPIKNKVTKYNLKLVK